MSPINNGSSLKVETIIGDKVYQDEEVRENYYRRNMQSSPQREVGSHPMDLKPFGHNKAASEPVEEFKIDPAMESAIKDDLANRGVSNTPTKKTRKRKPKTT